MRDGGLLRLGVIATLGLVGIGVVTGVTAANSVPTSRLGSVTTPITPNSLKPPECAGVTLTALIVDSGTITGTSAAELIIGGTGIDTIAARGGTDCVVAGGGNDIVQGENGADVLLGGPGADTVDGGAGSDVCYGGPDLDTFVSCETQTQ